MTIEKLESIILSSTFVFLFISLCITIESLKLKRLAEDEASNTKIGMDKSEKLLLISRLFLVVGLSLAFSWFYFMML